MFRTLGDRPSLRESLLTSATRKTIEHSRGFRRLVKCRTG